MNEERVEHPMTRGSSLVRDTFKKRRELDRRFMTQLYEMLSPEQVELLPALPSVENESNMIKFFGAE